MQRFFRRGTVGACLTGARPVGARLIGARLVGARLVGTNAAAALFASFALTTSMVPAAHASVTIDFEGDALAGIYQATDPSVGNPLFPSFFTENGFLMVQDFDTGVVGSNADLGSAAPSGDASQYYTNLNDGDLLVGSANGNPFSLDGFSAAFVPQSPASSQTIVLVAFAVPADSARAPFGLFFDLGLGVNGQYPFLTFNDTADFGQFTNLAAVDFFACVKSQRSGAVCNEASHDNGQFALDNIILTPAPEPTTAALMLAGLAGLFGWKSRRQRHATRDGARTRR